MMITTMSILKNHRRTVGFKLYTSKLLPAMLLFACSRTSEKVGFDEFGLHFPESYRRIPEQGLDAQVGQVTNDTLHFQYDLGYFGNQSEVMTEAYLRKIDWSMQALYQAMDAGDSTLVFERALKAMHLIDCTTQDSVSYELRYRCLDDTLITQVTVPSDVRRTTIEWDTINGIAYKLVNTPRYLKLNAIDINQTRGDNGHYSLVLLLKPGNESEREKGLRILRNLNK